jgi:hypothetical protein
MRKQLTRAILVTGTVAGALCLGVPAAFAVTTWTVTGGTNFTSVQKSGTTFTLKDTKSGSTFTCTVATGKGTVTDETHGTNTAIGSVTASTFGSSGTPCNGPFGAKATASQSGTATLNVSSYNSTTGTTTGTITSVDEVLTVTSPISCTITVTGTAGVTYTNSTSLLQFTTAGDNLTVKSSSCPGVSATDPSTESSGSGGEVVTGSPVNPISVSSP